MLSSLGVEAHVLQVLQKMLSFLNKKVLFAIITYLRLCLKVS